MSAPPYGAVLLAGGRATRMGGAAKPLIEVGGRSMLARAVDAVHGVGAAPIVIVADPVAGFAAGDARVQWVREDPPFAGPAAAIVAALRPLEDEQPPHTPRWTFVLACDLPRVDRAVRQLLDDSVLLPSDTEGVCLADAGGRPQWLTGLYRTDALRRAAAAMPDAARDAPMRALLDDLAIAVVRDRDGGARDVDTWEDLTAALGAAPDTQEHR
ncbi:molybdenum cofactor guanylyltransferase [Microbacterium fluvii]|uniref:Molybdenum cofactor guanylyltransferase n=1 Tax=Microbacterium fluvii TaxID=415215 RepID=A0ABW2H9M5_9MICO|nr:NTP transferase domain-containing protein [Microbacterium fluvii]MCU4671639.1 NTP transferase domain-containing protein [Microbacterium fluvii]